MDVGKILAVAVNKGWARWKVYLPPEPVGLRNGRDCG